jgi:hypothetical protein
MGCCCSIDEATLRAERSAANPKEPHHEWSARMLADIGTDVNAVSRDFPRMQVRLRDPDVDVANVEEAGLTSPGPNAPQGNTKQRHAKVLQNVVAIAELCGEKDTIALKVKQWLDAAMAADLVLLGQPDACPVFRQMQTDTGLVAAAALSNEPTDESTATLRAACKTFRVLEYLVQGIVFYPVQRLSYLLWFPWSTRITDFEWHTFVCTRPQFPEHVYVIHRQVSRNYVDKKDAASTPAFEFEWDLVIAIKSTTGDFDDAQINMRRVTLRTGGSVADGCCGVSQDAQLMQDRVDQLTQRVMDSFHVEVERK